MKVISKINPYAGVFEKIYSGDNSIYWAVSDLRGFLLSHGKLAQVLADPELPECEQDAAVAAAMKNPGHPKLYRYKVLSGYKMGYPVYNYAGYSIFPQE